ncbi:MULTISPECIES: hypothetical protein [Brenneria]|uniref:Uncharacterized protein n=1 Tax=Brenneria nigrifluens DSM 30175 = ATCC 13028 TaxID=1121120 RepID=A0A2U1UH63_9GAMM|nr:MULTISPECIES: hypothetical protein [Brenneria]EHD19952.1 hypothetical protein BrE312_0502 [Brenneria sp. EniD312]PWC20914.1 hypothetical protein DDT54_20075 [Brenneria nigrifluens DSM 30175 = ATCC 13028]QCR03198.1 hypothetical protein EH206_02600 [Brenneria nigrifluens DSM 30175 = ATCC 13028]
MALTDIQIRTLHNEMAAVWVMLRTAGALSGSGALLPATGFQQPRSLRAGIDGFGAWSAAY